MFQNITLCICTVKTICYPCSQFGEASKSEHYNMIMAHIILPFAKLAETFSTPKIL